MPQLETATYISQIFWLIVTFFSLWIVMSVFFVPRLADILEQRRQKIEGYVQKAEQIKQDALQKLEMHENAVEQAKRQAAQNLENQKQELQTLFESKKEEMEHVLQEQIAQNEYMLAQERIETMAAMDKLTLEAASLIINRLSAQSTTPADLVSYLSKEKADD